MSTENGTGEGPSKGNVLVERRGDLAFLRLGTADERVVVLTEARMNSFREAVEGLAKDNSLKGLIITGSQPGSFCAGADINVIQSVTDAAVGQRLATMGQELFSQIAALPVTTVAAISGPCVGGGCELSLACDYRVLADIPETKIGLPEVKLGILPGFGGTQRLPRLIGLPQSLDMMLKGRLVSASRARSLGLADHLVSPSGSNDSPSDLQLSLETEAGEIALGTRSVQERKLGFSDRLLTWTGIGRGIVAKKVRKSVLSNTKGNYPAPLAIVDIAVSGLGDGLEQGFRDEAKALGELVVSPESKSLVYLYLLSETVSKRWQGNKADLSDAYVAVLGAGVMGAGVASSFLMADVPVVVYDPSADARARASEHIEKVLKKRYSRSGNASQKLSLLSITDNFADIAKTTLIVEAVAENFELKKKVFRDIETTVDRKAILASNTSSLPISNIAEELEGKDRVIGMHFFNPVEKMPLVEIVLTQGTDERAIALTAAYTTKLGKYPIVVKEVPGFLVNRVLSPYLAETACMLRDGYSIEDLDRAAVKFGMPMGPCRLLDEIGLDVASHVAEIMSSSYGERMEGPDYYAKLAEQGRLGRKSGKGFYRYEGKSSNVDNEIYSLLDLPSSHNRASTEEIADRLILTMVNEAIMSLDEGVAGQPGKEAAEQVDLGSVMGTGFAPFRGGIIRYAESIGAKKLLQKLQALEKSYGARFTPTPGVKARADKGLSFYEAA